MRAFCLSTTIFSLLFAITAQAQPTSQPALPKTLDRQVIRSVVKAQRPKLRGCAATAPGLSGRVVVKLVVEPAGTVKAAELEQNTLKAPSVESCVLGVLRGLRFPAAQQATTISYPLLIKGPPAPPAHVASARAQGDAGKLPATRVAGARRLDGKPARRKLDHALSDTKGPLPRDLAARIELFRRGDFTLSMGGLIQVQGAFYAGDQIARQFGDPIDKAGFRVRRTRLGFSGRLVKDFSYYIAVDLKDAVGVGSGNGDPGNEILDARILWDRFSWLNISAGVDRVPFSTFSLQSSARLALIERPLATFLLAPDRRVGLSFLGSVGPLHYALGVYNGSEGVTTGNQLGGIALAARVGISIFDHPMRFVPDKMQVSLNAAFMYDNQAAVDILRAAGSLEVSGFRTKLTGEFIWLRSTPDEQPAGTPDAGEVSRWSAIGELSVFIWRDVLQLAARYEYFRDNDKLPTFGKQQLYGGGLNVYVYQHRLKLQIDYLRRDELEGPEVANDIGFAQLQAMF